MARSFLVLTALTLISCSEDGVPLLDGPYQHAPEIVLAGPEGDVSLRPEIYFELDQYLAPRTIPSNAIIVRSSGRNFSVRTRYDVVSRRLVGTLGGDLEDGILYQAGVNVEGIVSVSGVPLESSPELFFFATSEVFPPESVLQPPVHWAEVEGVLSEGCGCHIEPEEPWFDLPAFTYDRIVGQPAKSGLDLVEPYHPARSELLLRVLPGYPLPEGNAMPPKWAGEVEVNARDLLSSERHLLSRWISLGAER